MLLKQIQSELINKLRKNFCLVWYRKNTQSERCFTNVVTFLLFSNHVIDFKQRLTISADNDWRKHLRTCSQYSAFFDSLFCYEKKLKACLYYPSALSEDDAANDLVTLRDC